MDINLKGGMPGMPMIPPQLPILLFVVGGALVLFGALLIANEWLLRWLVAGLFILAGLLVLMIGLRAKRMIR